MRHPQKHAGNYGETNTYLKKAATMRPSHKLKRQAGDSIRAGPTLQGVQMTSLPRPRCLAHALCTTAAPAMAWNLDASGRDRTAICGLLVAPSPTRCDSNREG